MLDLDLTHVLVIAGFVIICTRPRSWIHNATSALACWAATYTLSNGLVAFVVAAFVVQLAAPNLYRLDRLTAFWGLNIVAVLALYLPHLNEALGPIHLLHQIKFVLAYLGSPLASLLIFPYHDMFEIPLVTGRNAIAGCLLLSVSALTLVRLRTQVRTCSPAMMLYVAFTLFAIGSAMLTGWGRADFDAYGVANANASRYTIFGSYFMYGLIYASSADWRFSEMPSWFQSTLKSRQFRAAVTFVALTSLALVGMSYWRSRVVYQNAHDFNRHLAAAFWNDDPAEQKNVYPNPDALRAMKVTLRRLRLGPYRFSPHISVALTPSPALLGDLAATKLLDQFQVDGLKSIPPLGEVIFANPASRFALFADQVKMVQFEFGIADLALQTSPPPAGVVFRLVLRHADGKETELWTEKLTPVTTSEDRGTQRADVSLSGADADQLIFETQAIGNPVNEWAYWRNIAVLK